MMTGKILSWKSFTTNLCQLPSFGMLYSTNIASDIIFIIFIIDYYYIFEIKYNKVNFLPCNSLMLG